MSATRGEREQHPKADRAAESPHLPYWKRAHRSPFFWIAVIAMLAAMVIFVTSLNLAFRPRGQAPTAGNTP